ncbi:MAG: M66 family metalloprotease, partial [Planctomycetota bacterium]
DNYSTVYLRHSFEFETAEGYVIDALNLRALVDDGCIVTLNGRELHRFHVSAGDKTYQDTADNHEASAWEQYEVTDPSKFPVPGTNVLAVHALNQSISSSDFTIDIELIANFVPTGTDQWSEYSDTWYFDNGPPPVSELTIAGVYLAQTHVLEPDDPLFKLVGNRPALLKVQVLAPEGTAVPPITAFLSVGRATTTLTLDGPDTLQDTFKAAPGLVEHRYDDSFTTLIPAEWVRPGLRVRVAAGSATVYYDIKVGAPTELKMKMFDIHYFGLGSSDYPAGALDELEAKWPVADLDIERIRDIDFLELVIPARSGAPNVRVASKQDYKDQTGLNFDGEQAAALQWVEALSASGGNYDVAMQYINIIGVSAGGQAGGFDGVGAVSRGILNHELGHALSLPHWGDSGSYPYKGEMYGIEPQPGVYKGTHVGPTWGFDLPSMTFIPPTVQENSVGGAVGYYKKSPMQGGGAGDQEQGFHFRHFSDYGVNKMQRYIEGKVAVFRDGYHYEWDDEDGGYTKNVTSDGVRYPIEHDVQVISVMASMTLADRNVNMVYPPIGPYEGNLILTFDPTSESDRAVADEVFCPSGGCDFTLRVVQGGLQKTYMLPASAAEGDDPYSRSSLKTEAVNLRASDGSVTQVELLLTPDAEKDGLPNDPEVLYIWAD